MGISAAAIASAISEAASAASAAAASATGAISGGIADAAMSLGIPQGIAGAIGSAGVNALEQGAIGAALDPRAPLKGLEAGAISGGVMGGFAPAVSDTLGIGMTAADALTGAAGGALGALATGGKPLQGALQGGASGAAAGALGLGPQASTTTPTTAPAGTGGGPVGSAAGAAVPASVPTAGPDVSQPPVATGPPTSLLTPASSSVASPLPGNVGAGAAAGGGTTTVGGPAATTLPSTATPSTATPSTGTDTGKEGGGFFNKLMANPGALVSAAGMGASLLGGNKLPKEAGILSSQAAGLLARGQRERNYLETGTLPPGAQQGLDAATAAGTAAIKQSYANRGMSGSSAELQDIQGLRITAATQGQDMALKLLQQGASDTQLGNDLYKQLLDIHMQQDKDFADTWSGFATSLASLGRSTAPAATTG